MRTDATNKSYAELNRIIKENEYTEITNCLGQRFLADGTCGKRVKITGTAGNDLGAFLSGGEIEVFGNAQDALGDTMDDGEIIVHGSAQDAAGYAMRGGSIYIEKDVGYRAGIHMKAYNDKTPAIVVGGSTGSFLGEYQAGGYIIVLGLFGEKKITGYFCGTGMHGGKIYLRTDSLPKDRPAQVKAARATEEDLKEIEKYISEFCKRFKVAEEEVYSRGFFVLTPNSANPYKKLYVQE